jgi:gliding motility-associated-like protein
MNHSGKLCPSGPVISRADRFSRFSTFFCFFSLFLCVSAVAVRAQCVPTNQDCLNAIPVCQSTYTQTNAFSGSGCDSNEINPQISCMLTGERNDVWYTFTVQQSGDLNFSITPNKSSDDYDWALFDLTNNSCKDIFTNASLAVSCNFSNNLGCGGVTGANGQTTGSCGLQNAPVVPVMAGQVYVLNVSNFASSQAGYVLDLSQSTAHIFDTTRPKIQSVAMLHCTGDSVFLTFNKNILCSSVMPASFTLTGPGGPYTVTGVYSPSCQLGLPYGRRFTLITSPALTASGTYTVSLNGATAKDVCGNVVSGNLSSTFNVAPVVIASDTVMIHCNKNNATALVNITGGTAPLEYVWTPNVSVLDSARSLSPGNYAVKVSDLNGCFATHVFHIPSSPPMTLSLSPAADTICAGKSVTLAANAAGGEGSYTYSWNQGLPPQTSATVSPAVTTVYTFTLLDSNKCRITDTARVVVTPFPNPAFRADTTKTCSPGTVNFKTFQTTPGAIYNWTFGDSSTSSLSAPSHIYQFPGCFAVTLILSSPDGKCTSTQTDSCLIHVLPGVSPAFTASPNQTDILTPFVQFSNVSANASYWHWNFGDDSTSILQNPGHTYASPGQYPVILIVSNSFGCKDSLREMILLEDAVTCYIPNAFTPNADGRNDTFGPVGFHITPANFEMTIFNRWGLEVYTTKDPKAPWNGNLKDSGIPAEDDMYAYRITFREADGTTKTLTGGVLLLR